MRSIIGPKRRIQEVSKKANQSRISHGYLAEDYDGIGQYVLITFSRSSVAGAYRARIAAGDFGTGQTIPQGTPVSVFTYHGQIEILSMGAK